MKGAKKIKKMKIIIKIRKIKEIKKRYYISYIKLNNRFFKVIINFLIKSIIITIIK